MRYAVVLTADNNYVQHFCVEVKSILINNPNIPLEVYLLNEGLTDENKRKILNVFEGHNATFENIVVNSELFSNLHIGAKHLSIATFYRLLIPKLVKAERVLYLDSDMIVTGSIKELFEIDFENNYLLAVEDTYTTYAEKMKRLLNMSEETRYFNSGTMMINCTKWKEDNLAEKIIEYVANNPDKVTFPEQDGLNAVIDTQWKALPLRYNIQYSLLIDKERVKQEQNEINNKCIVHFTGGYPFKPWLYVCINPFAKEYWKYLKMTPFKDYKPKPDYKGWIIHKIINPLKQIIKK